MIQRTWSYALILLTFPSVTCYGQTLITGVVTRDIDNQPVSGVRIAAKRIRDNRIVHEQEGESQTNGRFQIRVLEFDEPIVLEFLPLEETLAFSSLRLLSSEPARPPEVKQQEINKVLSVGGVYKEGGAAQKGGETEKADAEERPPVSLQNQIGKLLDFEEFYYRTLSTPGELSDFDKAAMTHIRGYLPQMPNPFDMRPSGFGAQQKANGAAGVVNVLRAKQRSVSGLYGVTLRTYTTAKTYCTTYRRTKVYRRRCWLFRRRR